MPAVAPSCAPVRKTVIQSKPAPSHPVSVTINSRLYHGTYVVVGGMIRYRRLVKARPRRLAACWLRISLGSSSRGSSIYEPRCQPDVGPVWITGGWAGRATWPLTTCPRATLRTSSDERHQNRPYSDQTKRHPGSGNIRAHRSSSSHSANDDACTRLVL
jgi:hypothetical protein